MIPAFMPHPDVPELYMFLKKANVYLGKSEENKTPKAVLLYKVPKLIEGIAC